MAEDPTPPAPAPQGGPPAPAQFDINTVVAGMLQKANGDASKVLKTVLKENYQYRQELGSIKAKVPGEGSVVLAGDDAKRWEAYRSLGDDPAKVKAALDSGAEAVSWKTQYERDQSYEKAAKASGYNPALFRLLAKDSAINTVVEDAPDGKGKQVATAFVVDDKGNKLALAEYAKANWSEHLPLLGGSAVEKRVGNLGSANDTPPPPRPGDGAPDVLKALGASRYRAIR